MRWTLTLAILFGTLCSGCLFKDRRRAAPLAINKTPPPLPSPLEKGQTPPPPRPVEANSTLPDTTEYKSVAIPPAPKPLEAPAPLTPPAVTPVLAIVPDPDASDEEKKRLLERLREKREKEKEAENEKPMLPPAIAPKPNTPKTTPSNESPKDDVKAESKNDLAAARELYNRLLAKYKKLNDYESYMTRREVVGGKEMPTEEILFQFRKQPFSVYMKNLGEVGKGREVLYVEGKFDGLMHVVTGQGDVPRLLVGIKNSLKPDSPMVTSKSRHMITEAGPGHHLAKIDKYLKLVEAGKSSVKYLGTLTRKDQPKPVEGMEIAIPPGQDPLLPKGGKWVLYFEGNPEAANFGNLMVHQLYDETGREVEYYCFTKFRAPANLTDADFHPDRLGAKKK